MSDSDMDIDDDEVQVNTVAGKSELLLHTPIQASNFQQNGIHSDEQAKIIKDSCGSFEISQSGNSGKSIKLEDGKCNTLSDSVLRFPAPVITTANPFLSRNEPEKKRAAILCKFFAKGLCAKGNFCKFLHVKENPNLAIQQQAQNNLAGSSCVQSLVNHEMRFVNNSNPFPLRSSFVLENRSFGPAWTGGSLFSSVPINGYASNAARHLENRNNIFGSGSLPRLQDQVDTSKNNIFGSGSLPRLQDQVDTSKNNIFGSGSESLPSLQVISVSSVQDAEVNTKSSDKKKVSSIDWETSEPFQPSFTIPPYILPSSDALYDPLTDIENVDKNNTPMSSKGKQKDGDSCSGPQAREDCNNDDKNSSCSQNQHQEVAREANGIVEGVATSVVDQNDAITPRKEMSSSSAAAAVENNGVVVKRCKTAEVDGEVRSDAGGMKITRLFRSSVVETIKEMLKPLWREGRLTKDVHNMIVKRATEKIVNTAVQFHQVPTETETVEQYLSMCAPKIVKLVEGYVEKYGKLSGIK